MIQFLRNLFTRTPAPEKPRLVLPTHERPPPPPPKPEQAAPSVPPAKKEWSRQATQRLDPEATPEELCGLTPEMTEEQISSQLGMLYRRHNRAASSLEANLREEAEIMLDVIAAMRQKYLK